MNRHRRSMNRRSMNRHRRSMNRHRRSMNRRSMNRHRHMSHRRSYNLLWDTTILLPTSILLAKGRYSLCNRQSENS